MSDDFFLMKILLSIAICMLAAGMFWWTWGTDDAPSSHQLVIEDVSQEAA